MRRSLKRRRLRPLVQIPIALLAFLGALLLGSALLATAELYFRGQTPEAERDVSKAPPLSAKQIKGMV